VNAAPPAADSKPSTEAAGHGDRLAVLATALLTLSPADRERLAEILLGRPIGADTRDEEGRGG